MGNSRQTTLVLGGTGRTGSLVARKLAERGLSTRYLSAYGSGQAPPASLADFAHRNAHAWAVPAHS